MQLEDYETVAMAEMIELLALNETNPDTESATIRALRAQVRSLEQALESATEEHLVSSSITAAVAQSYRHQVLLAARAVADRVDGDSDPRHAAARVVAAVERLGTDGFRRPLLPVTAPVQQSGPSGGPGATPAADPDDDSWHWGPPAA